MTAEERNKIWDQMEITPIGKLMEAVSSADGQLQLAKSFVSEGSDRGDRTRTTSK